MSAVIHRCTNCGEEAELLPLPDDVDRYTCECGQGTFRLVLWRLRELENTQCFVLETPALVLKDGYQHVPSEKYPEGWQYPQPSPNEAYEIVWTAVSFGSEENLDCIADGLNYAQHRMF